VSARAGDTRLLVLAALLSLGLVAVRGTAVAGDAAAAPARIATVASGRCGVCHPADRVAFETSPHAREDVHCTSCHGGDDTTDDEKQAHGKGFLGKIDKAAVPQMCARCHADEKRMRPYDIPVDQYDLYKTSRHGQLLAKGDRQVAVCSDCHGAHDILAVADPMSRVYPTNVPRTCGRCHGDTTLVRQRKIHNTYAEYLTSVHAHQLFDLGNLRAPTCVSCHGVHGAAPPEVGDVTKVCGRCHTTERRYFIAGPHATKMAANNVPACIACHGDHGVDASVVDRLGSNCVKCHEKGDELERIGPKMLADYKSARRRSPRRRRSSPRPMPSRCRPRTTTPASRKRARTCARR
jgi:predicted CXXCH cytochrome family protein